MGIKSASLAKEVRAVIQHKLAPLHKDADKFTNLKTIADGAKDWDEPESSKRVTISFYFHYF